MILTSIFIIGTTQQSITFLMDNSQEITTALATSDKFDNDHNIIFFPNMFKTGHAQVSSILSIVALKYI